MNDQEVKPLPQCQTVDEVLATLQHLVIELNTITGVKATMKVENLTKGERQE